MKRERHARKTVVRVPRFVAAFSALVLAVAGLFAFARSVRDDFASAPGLAISILAGLVTSVLVGSIGEWMVHRWAMHRPSRIPILRTAFLLHHRAHHWQQFPPDAYVHEGPIRYPSVLSAPDGRICTSRASKILTVASHAVFYAIAGLLLAVGPAWIGTANPLFAAVVAIVTSVLIFFFIHIHDAIHYPGTSPFERFGWFRFLDRHHYLHHVDGLANTNFLLPLGDLLFGTLRRTLSPEELEQWPTYEQARARPVHAVFDARGIRQDPSAGAAMESYPVPARV